MRRANSRFSPSIRGSIFGSRVSSSGPGTTRSTRRQADHALQSARYGKGINSVPRNIRATPAALPVDRL
ncbi:hypothetical protein BSIN_1246 [Burkholderia singularis]|uniref:Uncharacterized protein n=1 Tax=Burkholderia singularis TaxID=1503053 RepID=A0A238HCW0_9BURK|nr:hypothetical protein BSIN_1246 [Burkholderia singularis]